MSNSVVPQFTFTVIAETRDECLARMDELGRQVLDILGGAPWLKVDDDVKKAQSPYSLKDDQGYVYVGTATYQFNGPLKSEVSVPTYEGFSVQHGIEQGE